MSSLRVFIFYRSKNLLLNDVVNSSPVVMESFGNSTNHLVASPIKKNKNNLRQTSFWDMFLNENGPKTLMMFQICSWGSAWSSPHVIISIVGFEALCLWYGKQCFLRQEVDEWYQHKLLELGHLPHLGSQCYFCSPLVWHCFDLHSSLPLFNTTITKSKLN